LTEYSRRQVVQSLAALGLLSSPGLVASQSVAKSLSLQQTGSTATLNLAPEIAQALTDSPLIYLTPIKLGGDYSRCQSEVWFVVVGGEILVCTDQTSWRAQAVMAGLQRTQIWVGDVGVWEADFKAHLALPSLRATARIAQSAKLIDAALDAFGDQYPVQWLLWGNRFRKGLANGSRVMLAYRPSSAPL